MKQYIPAILCSLGVAHATVTLQFSDFSASLTGIADSGGTASAGLTWGIVVDTAGDGFTSPFDQIGVSIADGALFSADDMYFNGGTTLTTPGLDGGAGGISTVTGLDVYNVGNVPTPAVGDSFAIIWFDSGTSAGSSTAGGTRYGLLTNAGLVLPSDGSSQPYQTLFAGPDPTRSADLSFIPEPSTGLLGLLGLSILLRRRR